MSEKIKLTVELELTEDEIRDLALQPLDGLCSSNLRAEILAARAWVAERDAGDKKRKRDKKFGLPWHSMNCVANSEWPVHEFYNRDGNVLGRNKNAINLVLSAPYMAELLERLVHITDFDLESLFDEAEALLRKIGWIDE